MKSAVLAMALLSGGAAATHVTDKLAVGLYAGPGDAQPARLLTSGTPVERLEQGGESCLVRLGSGEQGWLECRYLTDEKPARAMLLEAQASAAQLRRELDEARGQIEARQLDLTRMQRRLAAAENLLGEALPADDETTAPEEAPESPAATAAEEAGGLDWMMPGLSGLALGLLLGSGVFFWRCRRRYGGLRI
jgi:SH3 domain protein